MRGPFSDVTRASVWHRINHSSYGDFRFDPKLHIAPNALVAEDIPIAKRLLASFREALAHEEANVPFEQQPNSGLWLMLRNARHSHFYSLAAKGDVDAFAQYLVNALHTEICTGLGPGPHMVRVISGESAERDDLLLTLFDNIVSCAEALGALPLEGAEQGRFGENVRLDIADVVSRIEQVLGRRIGRAPVMGMTGVDVDGRIVDIRLADDIYSASRLTSLSKAFSYRSICEIGGGFGGLADEAHKAGIDRYTIVDLPPINTVQAFFLMKAQGPDAVRVFGESRDAHFHVVPYWDFYNPALDFDFVVNRDSMAEMPAGVAHGYLTEMERRKAAFLSINQEGMAPTGDEGVLHLNTSASAAEHPALRRISRHRYWTRSGYVEEFYMPA